MGRQFVLALLFVSTVAFAQSVPEVKVALLGDTEAGTNFGSVLNLIANEKADVIMINGDFGYDASPSRWRDRLLASIDINNYSVIGSMGNHDVGQGNEYVGIFAKFRNNKNNLISKCTGSEGIREGKDTIAVDEVCNFGNVSIISSAIGQVLNSSYLEGRLEEKLKNSPASNWKLVGYHFTLANMNPGYKSDQATYKFFDLIRQYGAIGTQAHTHSVMASCPISSVFALGRDPACHPDFADLENRFVLPGTGLFVDSSLAGKPPRNRGRCKNPTEKNCGHLIDIISGEGYTRADGAKFSNFTPLGAMFMVFNAGGDPAKTLAYFKSIDGQVVFKFNIGRLSSF